MGEIMDHYISTFLLTSGEKIVCSEKCGGSSIQSLSAQSGSSGWLVELA